MSHHCCDRGALSGWFSKCLTVQQTRISCIEIIIAICQVMEDIFSPPVQMYRKSYCISPGVGVDIGSGGVSKMLKFCVKVFHLLDKQSCMWIFCNHFSLCCFSIFFSIWLQLFPSPLFRNRCTTFISQASFAVRMHVSWTVCLTSIWDKTAWLQLRTLCLHFIHSRLWHAML